ncbi:protein PFC0760c-like [Microplitis mediator]|uniref:protein PFC0760c-like n=1 Tax=Microplitis mediator TaxID=375433 RepID=UPI0025529A38|nr:protein PFC0760c-like [Microplitis mediator]
MSGIPKFAIIKYMKKDKPIYKIVQRSMIYIRNKNGLHKVKDPEDLNNENIFFSDVNDEIEAVQIIDTHDDLDELRKKNEHISDKRIPLVKRQSMTPLTKNVKETQVTRKPKKKTKKPEFEGDIDGDQYFNGLDAFNNNHSEELHDKEDEDLPPPITPAQSPTSMQDFSFASPPRQNNDDHFHDDNHDNENDVNIHVNTNDNNNNNRSNNNNNVLKDIQNLKRQLYCNNQELGQIKKNMVTKNILNETLNTVVETVTTKNDSNSRMDFKEPLFDAENQVKIFDDFIMSFDNYYSAINATTNCRRAKAVMREFWSPQKRSDLVVKFNPKKPDMSLVSNAEYAKLIKIVEELQKYKKITIYTDKDRVSTNIIKWVGEWLKSMRYTRKKNQTE